MRRSRGRTSRRKGTRQGSTEMAIDSSMIGIPPAMGTGPGTGIDQKYSLRVNYTGIDEMGNEVTTGTTIYECRRTRRRDLRATAWPTPTPGVVQLLLRPLRYLQHQPVILNQV